MLCFNRYTRLLVFSLLFVIFALLTLLYKQQGWLFS